ncbi:heme exporter protein CcmD [Labrenzia sp. 011]|uniref:heme exporter protein CcmD n=1 Tax=Labrenzia sp. 011 TaxID=2171494 RepID=UPI000D50E5A4|nr:heme exporter protein CcmD [Labrenzia sp. 011]PVB61224.1 heme exporter protein CcmD [Labrenzia sp. 011]
MDLGPHSGFIIASYGLCLVTVLGLIAWVRIDKAIQEKALRELAEQGVSRRRPDAGGR